MSSDYTMDDFRAEMHRRGIHAEPSASRASRAREHGNAIGQILPCAVHPLHAVKIRASGARTGCPMCEMQIQDLCSSLSSKPADPPPSPPRAREHAPRITNDRTRIVACACGWRTPAGAPDSEEAYIEHATGRR